MEIVISSEILIAVAIASFLWVPVMDAVMRDGMVWWKQAFAEVVLVGLSVIAVWPLVMFAILFFWWSVGVVDPE